MYPPAIAQQLRELGHDAEAVAERAELRALDDGAIFTLAQRERRAVVTENIADFSVIANEHDQRGRPHEGLVLVSPSGYPRGNSRTIGRMVTALDRVLNAQPEEGPRSLRLWL
jgi:hypothetical protein